MLLSPSMRWIITPMMSRVPESAARRSSHLQRCPQARQGVSNLVGDHGGKLAQMRERRLFPQLRFGGLAGGDVASNRQVLPRLSAAVEERDDGRVHPVEGAVLGAIANFPSPDAPTGDRVPQVANELLRVIGGVDEAVVLPEQLLARVPRDLAELVVDVRDDAPMIRRRDDRRLVEGVSNFIEPLEGVGHGARRVLCLFRRPRLLPIARRNQPRHRPDHRKFGGPRPERPDVPGARAVRTDRRQQRGHRGNSQGSVGPRWAG